MFAKHLDTMQQLAIVAPEPDLATRAASMASALAAARRATSRTSWLLTEVAASETPAAAVGRISREVARLESCEATVEDGRRAFEDAVRRVLPVRATPPDAQHLIELDAHITVVLETLTWIDRELRRLRETIEYLELVQANFSAAATAANDWSEPTGRQRWAALHQLLLDCEADAPEIAPIRQAFVSASRVPPEEAAQTLEREIVPALAQYAAERGLWLRDDAAPVCPTAVTEPSLVDSSSRAARARAPHRHAERAPPQSGDASPEPPARATAVGLAASAQPAALRLLTIRQAADRAGFKTTGAVRKALLEGRITSVGRRGGTGCHMFDVEEVERFARGGPSGEEAALGTAALAPLLPPTAMPASPEKPGIERRGASVPAGATVWINAKDVQEAVGCGRTAAYEHLHRAGGKGGNGTASLRISLEQWERYANGTFGNPGEQQWNANRASDPAAPTASSTPASTSTASASSAPLGPRTWRKRSASSRDGSAKPRKIRPIIPRGRRSSSA